MGHQFIKGRDIVLFSSQSWESKIGSNFIDMAHELARFNRVLFINRASDRASLLSKKKRKSRDEETKFKAESIINIKDNFWVYNTGLVLESINWISWNWLYDQINKTNNKRLSQKTNHAIEKLGFKDVILINDNDFFRGLYLKEKIPSCKTYIFYIRDYLTIQPYYKKHGGRLEKKMFMAADIVVANSAYLAKHAKQWNKNSYDIGQGCDLKAYLAPNLPIPDDLKKIPGPIIGYCGAVSAMRLDHEIIEALSQSFPACSIVLVGPTDSFFEKSSLKNCKNIYFLGGKPPDTVPNYIAGFDICINPQLINLLTIGNYPRKIDEYLAMGKPVVATTTDGMAMFSKHVFLCDDKAGYVKQISSIFSDKNVFSKEEAKRRTDFALLHTWENSIGLLGDAYHSS